MLVLTLDPKTGMQIASVVALLSVPRSLVLQLYLSRTTILGAFGLVLAQVKELTHGQLGSSFCYLQL